MQLTPRWAAILSKAAVAAPTYTGLVATRGGTLPRKVSAATAVMARSAHIATTNINSLQALWGNWYADSGGEHGIGATATITASVEYPSGTFTQILFSGSASGSIASGATITSDAVGVSIPNGSTFWLRYYFVNSAGFPYSDWGLVPSASDKPVAMNYTTATDQTMGGTLVPTSGSPTFSPLAIIGATAKPSILLAGDSRMYGYYDLAEAGNWGIGQIARALSPSYGYSNFGVFGEFGSNALVNYTKRSVILPYVTHVINNYGVNDIFAGGKTAAQTASARASMAQTLFAGKTSIGLTLTPETTSTDLWATTANQTVLANEGVRTAFNDLVRAGIPGEANYYEIADVAETSRNSGIWKATGSAHGYVYDGIHEVEAMNQLITSSGAIDVSKIHR